MYNIKFVTFSLKFRLSSSSCISKSNERTLRNFKMTKEIVFYTL